MDKTRVVLNKVQMNNKKLVDEFISMGYEVVEEENIPRYDKDTQQ